MTDSASERLPKTSDLLQLLNAAAEEALKPRDADILRLRFGLTGEGPLELRAAGNRFGVSKQRINQILERSLHRIRERGQDQIEEGEMGGPCAQLVTMLDDWIGPNELEAQQRIVRLASVLKLLPPVQALQLATLSIGKHYYTWLQHNSENDDQR